MERFFHQIDWNNWKQRQVSHSSYIAEIIVCPDVDDRDLSGKQALNAIFPKQNIINELNVFSELFFLTILSLHEGRGYVFNLDSYTSYT